MQLVFDARQHALPQRRELWQTALCSAYIALDAELPGTNDQGSLSKDDFGPVSITDIRLSQHVIRRRRQHLAQLDKDCYYLQILQKATRSSSRAGTNCRRIRRSPRCSIPASPTTCNAWPTSARSIWRSRVKA